MIDPRKTFSPNGVRLPLDDDAPPPDAPAMAAALTLDGVAGEEQRPSNGSIANPPAPVRYNCMKCPGYCCSYPIITVSKRDLERLARWFGLSSEVAEKRFTRSGHGHKRIMRRKADRHFGKICRFFDTEKRRCTVYQARPAVCRAFPGGSRCGYYDFLTFERRAQGDPDFVASTDHR